MLQCPYINDIEEGKITALDEAQELDYEITDSAFSEPLKVYRTANPRRPNWWSSENNGRGKLELLVNAFKMDFTNVQACVYAGITIDQYKYFLITHPQFSTEKPRLQGLIVMAAKQGLVADVQNDPSTRKWILERKEPETYGNKQFAPVMPTDAETLATLTKQAFLDKDGKVLVSRDSLEIITAHGQ